MGADSSPQHRGPWHAVARSEEIAARHIFQTQVDGHELAVWRDDSGFVNAWENRCPHRGVRLSIGNNTGAALRCQYHGFQFASRTGHCTTIPAHPNNKVPSVMRSNSYECTTRFGLVWVNIGHGGGAPEPPGIEIGSWTTLRSLFVHAAAARVGEFLASDLQARPAVEGHFMETTVEGERLVLVLQPVNVRQTVIHGLLARETAGRERLALLRRYNELLRECADCIERESAPLHDG